MRTVKLKTTKQLRLYTNKKGCTLLQSYNWEVYYRVGTGNVWYNANGRLHLILPKALHHIELQKKPLTPVDGWLPLQTKKIPFFVYEAIGKINF